MKINVIILLLLLVLSNKQQAQTSWTQKADLGSIGRIAAVSFSLNNEGYVGGGLNSSQVFQDFWKYNESTDSWTQIANYPTPIRDGSSFVIQDNAYVGNGMPNSYTNLFSYYRYDYLTNTWVQIASYPGTGNRQNISFGTSTKGYVGGGTVGIGSSNYLNDFWEYNPSTDTWSSLNNLPFGGRASAFCFSINNKGYVTCGQNGSIGFQDLWEYDPSTNLWNQKTNFPGLARIKPAGFVINNIGYVGGGSKLGAPDSLYNDYYKYNPSANSWSQITDLSGTKRTVAVGFSTATRGYITTGRDVNQNNLFDTWCLFDQSNPTSSIEENYLTFSMFPNPANSYVSIRADQENLSVFSVILIDSEGREVLTLSPNFNEVINIDLSMFPKGIYFIEISSKEYSVIKKLVVE